MASWSNQTRTYEELKQDLMKDLDISDSYADTLMHNAGFTPDSTITNGQWQNAINSLINYDYGERPTGESGNTEYWKYHNNAYAYLQALQDTYNTDANADVTDTISQIADSTTANNVAENISSAEEGQATDAEDAQAAAKAARISAANSGLGEQRAGLLGSQQTTNNASTYAQANRNLQQSTQNDYLNKQGQAEALEMQAANMRKGVGYNVASGALQGAGSGAAMGAVISDENCKEPISNNLDEDKLKEQITQFKTLYRRLQELKRSRK